jgi:phosphoenolpyruvate carboxylase
MMIESTLMSLNPGKAREQLAEARHKEFAAQTRAEFELVRQQVLEIKQISALLDRDATLQRAIELRNPYVDPINLLQVDLLRRWRADGGNDKELLSALAATLGGIAQALQGA